jgi:predicted RNA-binding Zn ribbon-like protein
MAIYAPDTAPVPFELCGGHPALDFVNSFDNRFDPAGGKELLADYGALLRFVGEAGLLSPPQARGLARAVGTAAAGRVVRSARELREALAAVLYAVAEERPPSSADIEVLERRFNEVERPRQLQWVTAEAGAHPSLQWRWRGDQVKAAEFPVWLIAEAASQLVLSDAVGRVRTCEADSCRWLFLDTSKNHTRRWCNMKVCGNRAKARRFQERRAQ